MLQRILKRLGRQPVKPPTKYEWTAVQTGLFAGLTLYLPVEWGEEVIQGQHEREFLKTIQSAAPKGGVFYDIGAHYGWFSAAWLQCGGRAVEAFEPLAENRDVLQQMLSRNHWEERVRIHPFALGRRTGTDWLVAYPGDTSRTFILQEEEIHFVPAGVAKQSVSIYSLTDLAREIQLQDPDLIKIDVEGLEGDVIEGAQEFLREKKPPVMVEVHSTLNGLRTADLFGGLGYRMKVIGLKGKKKSLPLALWTHPGRPLGK
jgi:FkbM family methyltransferase